MAARFGGPQVVIERPRLREDYMFDDNDGGFGGPMFMLSMLGPSLMVMMMSSMLFFGLVLYVVARWRDNRAPVPDPQLGLKFALHFFRVHSYQILLMGTMVLFFSMLGKDLGEAREFIYRPAFGLIVPAGVVFGVMSVMLGKTNNYSHPNVARMFNGYNLIVVGMIGRRVSGGKGKVAGLIVLALMMSLLVWAPIASLTYFNFWFLILVLAPGFGLLYRIGPPEPVSPRAEPVPVSWRAPR
jgi:hypothetical protein